MRGVKAKNGEGLPCGVEVDSKKSACEWLYARKQWPHTRVDHECDTCERLCPVPLCVALLVRAVVEVKFVYLVVVGLFHVGFSEYEKIQVVLFHNVGDVPHLA